MDFSLLETKLIWATQRTIEPASLHSPMYADDIPAWLIRRGRVRLRYADEETVARDGQWILPKRGAAWHDFTDGAVVLSVRFRLRWPEGEDLFDRTRTLVFAEPRDRSMLKVAETLVAQGIRATAPASAPAGPEDYFRRQATFHRWLEIYATALQSAGFRCRAVGQTDPRLLRARELLEAASLASRLSRVDLARRVGWSLPQLTRRFAAAYGLTPRAYFDQRRFNRARTELTLGRRTIKEIAAELGFTDLARFSNWFTRRARRSPRHYREQVQL
jgi:AraC-like DNA-binding protein